MLCKMACNIRSRLNKLLSVINIKYAWYAGMEVSEG